MTSNTSDHVHRLADAMGRERFDRLMALATTQTVPAGRLLIEDGNPVDSLWLLDEGVCRAEIQADHRTLQLGRLSSGQWLGEVSLLTGGLASASIIAETELRLHRWSHETIRDLRRTAPDVAGALVRELIQVLMGRVRASDAEIRREADRLLLEGSDRVTHRAALARQSWIRKALERLLGVSDAPPAPPAEEKPSSPPVQGQGVSATRPPKDEVSQ